MLVCWDSHVPSLAPLYNAVLRLSLPTFTIQMGDREEVVSTGRLKPCLTPTWRPRNRAAKDSPQAAKRPEPPHLVPVLWIRIYYYADPDPDSGSQKFLYGSGS